MTELKTELGTLKITASTEPGYPGFFISLVRPDGNEFTPALVEVNETEKEPMLKVFQWGDKDYWGDPERIRSFTEQEIDGVFEEDEDDDDQ